MSQGNCAALTEVRKTNKRGRGALLVFVAALCLAAAGVLVTRYTGRWPKGQPTATAGPVLLDPLPLAGSETPAPEAGGFAYLTGEVRKEGVYPFLAGARWGDIVDAAGGLTPDADRTAVNLAAKAVDGGHLHVPKSGGGSSTGLPGSALTSDSGSKLVNVNQAGESDLVRLPGIGPVLARRIVEWRQKRGPFRQPKDLLQVNGIGAAKLAKLQPFLSF